MLHKTIPLLMLLVLLLTGGCMPVAPAAAPDTLTLASHDSFSVSEEVVAAFEAQHNVKLQFLTLGDAGEALNKIILSRDAPLADLFFGVDNTFLSRALNEDIFTPYDSPLLSQVPDDLELDPSRQLLPVDYGFVNINADKAWFTEAGLPLPATLEDLTKPEYANLLVAPNPATSSPGLAFMLATVAHFGDDGFLDYWQALRENGVLITSGWSEAYYEHFTVGSAGSGDRPLVVSYTTSPPADVLYATDGRTEPASVNISPEGAAFRQIEFVGILKNSPHQALAQAFVDFMLDTTFQEDIPLQMFVYPANSSAALPELFIQFGQTPSQPAIVAPEMIEANRDRWISAWTDLMLR